MQLFGLTLTGDPAPTPVASRLPDGLLLPRVYLELLGRWGPGAIGGDLWLHTPEQLAEVAYLFEREVEIDSALAERSPTDAMPLDEWTRLASFAGRDRLELAWVRGREADGPIWAIDVSMGHFARAGTFDELPALLEDLDRAAPPGPGMRWGFPRSFVTRAEVARTGEYACALHGAPGAVLAALEAWEARASAYSVYAGALDQLRAEDDGSERARATLALVEQRALARVGRLPA